MQRYLIVIEPTASGFSAYSPELSAAPALLASLALSKRVQLNPAR